MKIYVRSNLTKYKIKCSCLFNLSSHLVAGSNHFPPGFWEIRTVAQLPHTCGVHLESHLKSWLKASLKDGDQG